MFFYLQFFFVTKLFQIRNYFQFHTPIFLSLKFNPHSLYCYFFLFGMIYKINGFAISSSSFSIRIDPFFFIAIFFLTSFLDWFFFLILSLNIKLVWSWTSWLILCLIFHELWFWNINPSLRDLSGLVWFLIILN